MTNAEKQAGRYLSSMRGHLDAAERVLADIGPRLREASVNSANIPDGFVSLIDILQEAQSCVDAFNAHQLAVRQAKEGL